jgi:hypothetical protein
MEELRRLFRFFAATQCRGRSAVYQALSESVARDDRLLELIMIAPPEQRRPSLLFASVNWLLAQDATAELRTYYPIHGGDRPVDGALGPAFADFCLRHRAELRELLAHRSTQTNEVRRCVALRLGLQQISRRWTGPLHLVEIGTSAGLNLIFDRYAYSIDGQLVEGGGSEAVISTQLRGGGSLDWGTGPVIGRRLGLDQDLVDLADGDARRWLEAFIWPEQVGDLATLRAAIETFLTVGSAVELVRGNAVTDTARLISELPGAEPVIVFTATLLSYLSAAERCEFVDQLDSAAGHRRVGWIFSEAPGLIAPTGVSTAGLAGPLATVGAVSAVGVSLRGVDREDRLLALADPYLRWIAPARTAADDFAWAAAEGFY